MIISEDRQADIQEGEDLAQMFASRLARDVDALVAQRSDIEERWIEDMRMLRGQYSPSLASAIASDDTKSDAFVNLTRPKANMAKARLFDMLFPNDDRNWAIKPTPVPELSDNIGNPDPAVDPNTGMPAANPDTGGPVSVGEVAQHAIDEARKRADAMQLEIDDQLVEGKYAQVARDVIEDAIDLGTGVLKGPVIIGRSRKSWQKKDDGVGGSIHVLTRVEEKTPVPMRVDPWNFFPDLSVSKIEDAARIFERHYMTPRDLLDLAKLPGFNKDSIKQLLKDGVTAYRSTSTRIDEMREMAGLSSISSENRFEVWEYHGEVEPEELMAIGAVGEEEAGIISAAAEAIVWFCGPYVLKAVLNPMESDERPYSVFNWESDPVCVLGYGVPNQMRNAQNAANAAWRTLLENGGLSSGPQIVIDDEIIEPIDGSYELRGRKLWRKTDPMRSVQEAFGIFHIDSRQQELANIYELARQQADMETSIPTMMESDIAPANTNTATGATLWMNSANADFRRAVRNWDDNITIPTITRFYDYNMQFNKKESIKGDYRVDARGSSTLLVKEIQAQNMMQLAGLAATPVWGPFFKHDEMARKIVQAMQVPSDTIVKNEDELKKEAEAQKAQGEKPDPKVQIEQMKAEAAIQVQQLKMQEAERERQHDEQMQIMEQQTAIMKFAEQQRFSREKLEKMLADNREARRFDRQNKVDEMNLSMNQGKGI